MIRKKVCLIGTSAVGKTSLAKRFVQGIFSEKYLTTIGVKIDKKVVQVGGEPLELLIWDLNGEDRFQRLSLSYLRGMSGYLLVVDGTRATSLDIAQQLQERVQQEVGPVPFLVLLNKHDLVDDWELEEQHLAPLKAEGWRMLETSAKSGTAVEEAFLELAHLVHNGQNLDTPA